MDIQGFNSPRTTLQGDREHRCRRAISYPHPVLHEKYMKAPQSLHIFLPHPVNLEFGILHQNLTYLPLFHPLTLLHLSYVISRPCHPFCCAHQGLLTHMHSPNGQTCLSMQIGPSFQPFICFIENSLEIFKAKKNYIFSWFE